MSGSEKTSAAQLQGRAETLCHSARCAFGSLQMPPQQRMDRGYAHLQGLGEIFELGSSSVGLVDVPRVQALFIAQVRPQCYNRFGHIRRCIEASRMMSRSGGPEGKQVRGFWQSPVHCVMPSLVMPQGVANRT